jgi:phage-related protein
MEKLSPSPKFQPIKFGRSRETKSITPERWIQLQAEPLQSAGWLPGSDGIEIRSTLPTRIARTLFFVHEGEIILLHGFIKKTQKTPNQDRALALRRKMHTSKTVKKGTNIATAALMISSSKRDYSRMFKPQRLSELSR